MRASLWDALSTALVVLLAAAPFVLLTFVGTPRQGAESPPLSMSELAVGIKHASIASIEIDGSEGIAVDRFGAVHRFDVGPHTNVLHALSELGVAPAELAAVNYAVREPSAATSWWQAILTLAPMILLGMMVLIAMRAGGAANKQLMNFTKHRARRFLATTRSTCFEDVAGVDEAKQELEELVQFLSAPWKFAELGARCPRGVLLVGPPGTGKTLLARAVAGEARVPFFNICGSEFFEIVAGVGASRVRDLFEQADRSAPCVVFVDEIDAIGHRRGLGAGGVNTECEQALNQLLIEMDGFESRSDIIVLAATNRADILDPALLRPGRFDRQVVVGPPDLAGRQAILRVHARGKPLDATVDLARIAQVTTAFSGADLATVMNEAAILAARRGKSAIGMPELESAIERLMFGPESCSRALPATARARRAHHEAGRALTMHYLEHHPPVHKVTIAPHTESWGYTRYVDADEHSIYTDSQLQAQLTAALAGPAAERLVFPEVSSADESDISAATEIALAMIKRYGMSARLGPVALSSAPPHNYSESTARLVDEELKTLLDTAYQRALGIVSDHRSALDRLAAALLDHETLEGESLQHLLTDSSS